MAKLEAKKYTQEGKDAGTITLPERIFGVSWNPTLVHSVVTAMQGNARNRTAHAKDRSEVRGGGRKPWRQKGTGRARHGSRRSPLWTGGGVTFGPRNERNHSQKINKKVRAKTLATVLSKKFSDSEVLFVDALTLSEPKTKEAQQIVSGLAKIEGCADMATKHQNAVLFALAGRDENMEKSFRNIPQVGVMQVRDISPVALLTYKYVVFVSPEEALKTLEQRVEKKKEAAPAATTS